MRQILSIEGSSLLAAIVIALLIGIIAAVTFRSASFSTNRTAPRKAAAVALNIAEAGKEDAIARIKSRAADPVADCRITLIPQTQFQGGFYTVACSANASLSTIWLWSTGTFKNKSKRILVVADVGTPLFSLKSIRGAVTSRGNISATGTITIDGRDHDTAGANPVGGLYGVSSCGSITSGGSASIGGNGNAPPQPKGIAPGAAQANASADNFPKTPEDVLGLPPGTLDQQKKSGCPPNGYMGIWYTESDCDVTGSGIYILHNSTGTATLTNFHGNWKGLMIVDRVAQINGNGTCVGAIVVLSPEYSNIFGNGSATIKYSSAILNKLSEYCSASLERTVNVVSWEEL